MAMANSELSKHAELVDMKVVEVKEV